MRIKWTRRRVTRAKSPFIYLTPKGPVVWSEPGSIAEIDDESGYKLLEEQSDIVERVADPEPEKPKPGPRRRRARVSQNKKMKDYEDK